MATVSKRRWTIASGETKVAWSVTWNDRDGKRHRRQLATKRAADAVLQRVQSQLAVGATGAGTDLTIGQIATAFADPTSPIRARVLMRDARAQGLGFEFADMDLDDRTRLRALLLENSSSAVPAEHGVSAHPGS